MNKLSMMASACVALLLCGCADDELTNSGSRPVEGGEVVFGAGQGSFTMDEQASSDAATRTIYALGEDENGKAQTIGEYSSLDVNWLSGDKVRIYCPEAADGFQSRDYSVTPISNSESYGTLTKDADTGVRWGDTSNDHNFYAFYPALSDISMSGLETEAKVSASIPMEQDYEKVVTYSSETGEVADDGDWKIVLPNMDYAMMVASKTINPSTATTVQLDFDPLVTVLDVVVNGPESNDLTYSVLQVIVESTSQDIVGNFTYDYTTKSVTINNEGTNNKQASAYFGNESEGGIQLTTGQKLNVKFFLLPQDIKASELKVSVLMGNGQTLTKKLDSDGNYDTTPLAQGKIVKVQTPKLGHGDASKWMSLINDDVYFASQLSLPGSKHSFSSQCTAATSTNSINKQYQTEGIETQWKNGVRAFDIKVNTNGEGTSASIYVGGSDTEETLGQFLTELKGYLSTYNTEAAVVMINYVNGKSSDADWVSGIVNAINTWENNNSGILKQVTSSTTMKDMRGHIGIMVMAPEYTASSVSVSNSNIGIINGFSSEVYLQDIHEYSIGTTGKLYVQNLQGVNNPEFTSSSTYAYRSDYGLLPYWITDPNKNTSNASYDQIGVKEGLMDKMFSTARENTSSDNAATLLYLNDLGGYCVVEDATSTGWVNYTKYTYDGRKGNWQQQNGWGSSSTTYDYSKLSGSNTYVVTDFNDLPTTNVSNNATGYVLNYGDYGYTRGEGGNTALFAQYINGYAYSKIPSIVNEGKTPLGFVMMNFAGEESVTVGGTEYTVYGDKLPALIMANNFRVSLKTSTTTTTE